METVAIIGMSGRFPGSPNIQSFWEILLNKRNAITEVPADRYDVNTYYDPKPATRGKVMSRYGGFLQQIDQFDATFFGISPREAAKMDPQHRLLMEVAWEAIEDAGIVPASMTEEERAGIATFIGIISSDYGDLQLQDIAELDVHSMTGSARAAATGRIAYALNLNGTSFGIDAACSSSLICIDQAVTALRAGTHTTALAGGVNIILNPTLTIGFSQGKMMAGDGACKAFDEKADGYVRSEGVGVVVLKLLSRALADGDHIYAVIRGSACSNDGHCDSFMAPSTKGQQLGLRKAIQNAGVDPLSIDYVEAHGPGTRAGDPVEITTLGEVLCQHRTQPLLVGSVKTNIGHTEGSAGVAGLIKTVLCLQHGLITPNLYFETPSSAIPWDKYPITIPTEMTPWPSHNYRPRRAVVCSYGISGTNSYVVLEEAPQTVSRQMAPSSTMLLPLSARSSEALTALAQRYVEHLENPAYAEQSLHDLCYTASMRRAHHDYRLAVVSSSKEDAHNKLLGLVRGNKADPGLVTGRQVERKQQKIAWIFPGQGSQWLHMGRDLFAQEPAFRAAIEACDRVMSNYVDWSLLELLQENEDPTRLDEIDVIQPTLFAIEVALAELWQSWGIKPDAVVGHSMGETAAAYIAGALNLEDAAWIICSRSKLALRQRGKGLMAAVELSLEQASKLVRDNNLEELVSVAVSNSPNSTVLSGDSEAVQKILAILESENIFARLVRVEFASHCPQMDPLREDLLDLMKRVQPHTATVPMFSTVRGSFIDGKDLDAHYWVDNLREPVLFLKATQALLEEGFTLFMEMSPHPILVGAIRQTIELLDTSALTLGSLRRDEGRSALLTTLGTLYANGYEVKWSRFYPDGGRHVSLPTYPWQKKRYWNDQMYQFQAPTQAPTGSAYRHRGGHPILGSAVSLALHPDTYFWNTEINSELFPFLNEHRVDEIAVLPGSAYTELALAAATEIFGAQSFQIENVALSKALFFPKGSTFLLQAILSPGSEAGTMSFQLFSKLVGKKNTEKSWLPHAQATIRRREQPLVTRTSPYASPEQVRSEWTLEFNAADLYQQFRDGGMQHGALFQSVTEIWRHANETMAHLTIPAEIADDYPGYQLHPALLDAVQHAIAPFFFGQSDDGTFLPVSISQVRLYRSPLPGERLWSHAMVQSEHTVASSGFVEGDITLIDEQGEVLLEIFGFRLQLLDRSDSLVFSRQRLNRMLYTIAWEQQPLPTVSKGTSRKRWVIFSEQQGLGQDLITQIQAQGGESILVTPGETFQYIENYHYELHPSRAEDFQHLFTALSDEDQPSIDGVIYLWGLLTRSAGEEEPAYITPTSQEYGGVGMLHLIQAIATCKEEHPPRLWVVTRGVHTIEPGDTTTALFQAPLWGLRRVVAYEHPGIQCTTIDLASAPTQQDAQNLFREIWHEHDTAEVALRGNQRYSAQLVRRALPEEGTEPLFRADGTYLITGGLGGVGLRTAQWIVEQGARHIALMGRHQATEQARAKIQALRETGATISIVLVDVSQREQLAEALDLLRRKRPPIRGIFHSAVVLDDGTLLQLDRQRYFGVTPPKVDGSWNLHLLTRNDPLDYFVMFSTVASTLGSPAQGNYAAASAFMDALAFYRRQHGLPALALNWGRWAEVGQAIVNERMDARGFVGMKPIEGLTILGNLLHQTPPQISVMNFSFAKWSQFFPELLYSSFFAQLNQEERATPSNEQEPQLTRDMLSEMEEEQRQQALSLYLEKQIAQVLGHSSLKLEMHQQLHWLGIDSLLAVELKNRINADLGFSTSAVLFLQGLTFDQLISQIEEAMIS